MINNQVRYKYFLTDERWLIKRIYIIQRDGGSCVRCGSKSKLEVHHTYYVGDLLPWEYPDESLITVCSRCHRQEHNIDTERILVIISEDIRDLIA